jgi:putative membrane protein
MGPLYQFLFWIHMTALAGGGTAAFGIPIVGSQIGAASAETRPTLFRIADRLSNIGRAAIGLLIITGPLMFWLGWNFAAPNMIAFGVKMVLVLVLLALVIYAGINAKRAEHGDMAAAKRAPMLGASAAVTFVLVIASAALAFK